MGLEKGNKREMRERDKKKGEKVGVCKRKRGRWKENKRDREQKGNTLDDRERERENRIKDIYRERDNIVITLITPKPHTKQLFLPTLSFLFTI